MVKFVATPSQPGPGRATGTESNGEKAHYEGW